MPPFTSPRTPVRLSARAGAVLTARVLVPLIAEGPIIRRGPVVTVADRLGWESAAVRLLDRLAERYDRRPLLVRLGPRTLLLPLHPDDARDVLDATPEPFTPASGEKRSALRHFQPRAVLISDQDDRPALREWNEAALQPGGLHQAAATLVAVAQRDGAELAATARRSGELGWQQADGPLWATVRELVLGPGARPDTALTDDLNRLRSRANLAFARPLDRRRRARFTRRLLDHLHTAPATSLAGAGLLHGGSPAFAATQVPHWLFAYDAARITLWRALAVLAADPERQDAVRHEAEHQPGHRQQAAADAIRAALHRWPTTLVILRDATAATRWGRTTLDPGTGVALISAYLHRAAEPVDLSFSAGPAICPGRDVVVDTMAPLLAAMVRDTRWSPLTHPDLAAEPGPVTLPHHRIRLAAEPV
ncbi:cytochrome P450 [Cellulomonas denverensis]|uniref:Cytochrome P450 n=1 Tax=Cellulomonas denverensis TaxID=264297 RepID=A0A7X6KUA7_9CELL|nr:cytochrome P450 [Cellulomonas denverensis]NKY22437.1 cytochrome P450 [Cellulomonas denverensis]GIG25910.1 cytochrome P450 [Cellulomonas denverensis]